MALRTAGLEKINLKRSGSCLNQALGFGNRHQDAQAQTQGDHGGAAITDERQWHTDHRQNTADHAHVDEGIGKENHADTAGEQAGEQGGRFTGDDQAPEHQEEEARNEQKRTHQAKLL